jgi:hypothetical protein
LAKLGIIPYPISKRDEKYGFPCTQEKKILVAIGVNYYCYLSTLWFWASYLVL